MQQPPLRPAGQRRRFYLIAALLPLVLLALLEGLLRLSGQHHSYPLLIPAKQRGYLQLNPDLVQRYYASPQLAPDVAPDSQLIAASKAANNYRIVLMGGSSAAGFPYGRFGSPAAMLQQQLKLHYPAHHFEVINTAMAAINSYTLLDISAEVLTLQPDLVLIYAGHNEYLGIWGAAAGQQHGTKLLLLTLQRLAIVQTVQRLYAAVSAPVQTDHRSRTLMAKMAQQQHIAYNSPQYQAGLQQFNANMRLIVSRFSAAGVPVILSTLAANEADQPPFASPPLPEGLAPVSTVNLATLQLALEQQPEHAMLHYLLAQRLQQQAQYQQALAHFTLASDYDALRFRAPSAINQIIRQLSSEFALPLADGQQRLRADSPGGIIGNSLMLEHLHPNATGYMLLAEAFYQAMQPYLVAATNGAAWATAADVPQDWRSPLHQVDVLLAAEKIAQLKADYPFNTSPQPLLARNATSATEQLAQQRLQGGDWLSNSQTLLKHYQQQQDPAGAAKVAAQLSDALPYRADIASLAGQFYAASQIWPLAEFYQRRALTLSPTEPEYYLLLASSLYRREQYPQALAVVESLLQRQPAHAQALRQQAQLRQRLHLPAQWDPTP